MDKQIAIQRSTDLPSQRKDPERDRAIADVIRGPISAMTALHLMGDREKREAWTFWIESLRPYPPDWIRDAFRYFARNGGSKYPSPQRIIEIINQRKDGPSADEAQIVKKLIEQAKTWVEKYPKGSPLHEQGAAELVKRGIAYSDGREELSPELVKRRREYAEKILGESSVVKTEDE